MWLSGNRIGISLFGTFHKMAFGIATRYLFHRCGWLWRTFNELALGIPAWRGIDSYRNSEQGQGGKNECDILHVNHSIAIGAQGLSGFKSKRNLASCGRPSSRALIGEVGHIIW